MVKGKGMEEDYLNSPLPHFYHLPFAVYLAAIVNRQ